MSEHTPQVPAPDATRWEVQILEGPPRGGLYELEVRTRFQVVDRSTGDVVLEYVGDYEASYATDGSGWSDGTTTGVIGIAIAPDDRSASVRFADGHEETVPLPA